MNPLWNIIFFITALLYSSGGLGGASAYLAYLSVAGIEYKYIPAYALILSIISTFTSSFNWIKHSKKMIIPIILFSIPTSFLGGTIKIQKEVFTVLSASVLLTIGIIMLIPIEKIRKKNDQSSGTSPLKYIYILPLSALFGLIGGIIGIGCGVFLFPLLYLTGTANEKESASAGTIFILANSVFGLAGHLTKLKELPIGIIVPPAISVILGAFVGSYFAANKLPPRLVKIIFAVVVIIIAIIMLSEQLLHY
ncbi:MAG: TSUP family transporter [bacterium]|nr:TSUP family transporter [bacterium]